VIGPAPSLHSQEISKGNLGDREIPFVDLPSGPYLEVESMHELGVGNFVLRSVALVAGMLFALAVTVGTAAASVVPSRATTATGTTEARIASHSPDLAQVTVRPDAPKRVFEEKEDRPWTLLVGKAMLPATFGLGVFVVIWYVMKVTRTRYRKT
jgi:hypothetical protein